MDDIVTFLREDACQYGEWENACTAEGPCPSCMAADEIERLRTTNDAFIHVIENCMNEIERLRRQITAMKDSYDHFAEISKAQRDTMTKYLFQENQK